jgi:cell division septation protein DedD
MADKNLHDIKIDELDSPKKTPLKNILTLLALLFIILVISVVITKLILNTDEGTTIENNDSKSELLSDVNKTADTEKDDEAKDTKAKDEETKKDESSDVKVPILTSNITERNLTSVIKTPLTSHVPKKVVKEIKTYSTPKKNTEPKTYVVPKKNTEAKKYVAAKKVHTINKNTSHPKKEYIDKVVAKKNTTNTTRSSSTKNASFLGGKRKDITNSYYIKVGTYRDITTVINKVKKNNFNYAIVKVENDKTLLRVMVGPFFSRNQANAQLAKVKASILSGAYVTKAK